MKDEALKLALEALESSDKLINGSGHQGGLEGAMDGYYCGCFDVGGNNKLLNEAITAIKAALAQPAQEPVAEIISDAVGCLSTKWRDEWTPNEGDKLYSAPPQRKPLTDEQIAKIASTPASVVGSYVHTFARAIEAAHGIKEKNT